MVELDLQDIGVDVGDQQLMASRSWHWLRTRILGLLTRPEPFVVVGDRVVSLPVNRLQASFSGADVEQHRRSEEG